MRDLRSYLSALAASLLAVAVLAPGPASAADEAGSSTISNAVLRWGMSNEANNAAHAPGTSNFFSAGKIPDPGKGNVKLPQASWSQRSGDVAIEKWDGTAYRPATWAGLSTDASGVPITSASSGRYSGHQFVFSGGSGTLDRDSGTAHVAWTGDVTVLFYSGYSFFYLSDPVLDVVAGKGTLKATASGFGTSQADPTVWKAIDPVTVTVATLPSVDLDAVAGFTSTPAYDGVKVSSDGAEHTGSFPQSFIDFLGDAGTAAFWYSSGSSTDLAKRALPLTVSYDASTPVEPPDPVDPDAPDPVDPIDNDAPEPPAQVVKTVTNTITRTVTVPGAPVAVPAPAAPVVPGPGAAAAALTQSTTVQLLSAPAATTAPDPFRVGWWIGGVLLALAALVLAGALLSTSPSSRRIG